MVNIGRGVFDFTSNVSGSANVISGESTGAQYQLAPVDALRNRVVALESVSGTALATSGSASLSQVSGMVSGLANLAQLSGAISGLPNLTQIFPFACDYYVYKDANGIYNARNGLTGNVDFTDSGSVDPVINSGVAALFSGSVKAPTNANYPNLESGGHYGRVLVGPGNFTVKQSIVMKSNTSLEGCGPYTTTFYLASGTSDSATATVIKSSFWDTNSFNQSGLTAAQKVQGDIGIRLAHFSINGQLSGINTSVTTVNLTTMSGGLEVQVSGNSWGHGIALLGNYFTIEDVFVNQCPGAGVIVQRPATVPQLGLTTETRNQIHRLQCGFNGGPGLVIRGNTHLSEYESYFNGGPGLDVQSNKYVGGNLHANRLLCFLDSQSGGAGTNTTYNAQAPEVRIAGVSNNILSDSWIEGPSCGGGDSLMIGISGGGGNGLDYALVSQAQHSAYSNIFFDYAKQFALRINKNCNLNKFTGLQIQGVLTDPSVGDFGQAGGIAIQASQNSLEGYIYSFYPPTSSGLSPAHDALLMKIGSTDNHIRLFSWNNQNVINWQAAGGGANNMIDLYCHVNAQSGAFIFNPASQAVAASNMIWIHTASTNPSGSGVAGVVAGQFVVSGDGAATTFQISHGLYRAPVYITVQSAISGQIIGTSGDTTNVYFTYNSAPAGSSGKVNVFYNASANTPI